MERKKVILDVDTGSDDAVAIILAALSEKIDLVGICTTFGNLGIETTTDNTLRIVSAFGIDTPVYKGCARSLTKDLVKDYPEKKRRNLVDENGKPLSMHDPNMGLAKATREVEDMPSAIYYVDYLTKTKEKVTVVLVGPLTNFALALRIKPEIIENVEEVVVMGGGHYFANIRPSAEANIYNDPDAAAIVLNSGAKVTFIPLDVTHKAYITKKDCLRIRELNSSVAHFVASQIEQRIKVHNLTQPLAEVDAAAVHDPLTIAYLINPEVITDLKWVRMDISLSGASEGSTIIDTRYYTLEKNCYFAYQGDRKLFVDILVDALSKYKGV